MFFIVAGQSQLCLEGQAECQATLHTFFDGVAWWIDVVIKKLKDEDVSRVRDREVLLEHPVKPLVYAVFRGCFELKELLKGFELDFQQIRIFGLEFNLAEADPLLSLGCCIRCCGHAPMVLRTRIDN